MTMDDQHELSAWQEITGHRSPVVAERLTRPCASLREADPTDLVPVSRAEFAALISPCLQLVAPVGMDEESQATWIEAAFVALEDIPIGPLKRGCAAALRTADHPSKIVPAIWEEAGADWEWRKKVYREDRLCLPPPPRKRSVGALMDRRPGSPMTEEETADLNAHLERLGATARYRPDGSKYRVDAAHA